MGRACSFEKSVCWNTRYQVNKRESEGVFRNCSSLGFGLTQIQPCDCPARRTKKNQSAWMQSLIQGNISVGASASGLGSGHGETGLLPFIEQVLHSFKWISWEPTSKSSYHRDITVKFYLVSAFPIIFFENVFFRTAEFLKCLSEWGHFQYEVKIYTLQNSTIQENQKYPSRQDTLLLQELWLFCCL